MHAHLAENDSDIHYSREKFNMTPAPYVEDPGWAGPDVWHAHSPCSNVHPGSGIAATRHMCDAGMGVDGSASNNSSDMMAEVRQALELAMLGRAKVLNRDDVGAIAPGMMADLV